MGAFIPFQVGEASIILLMKRQAVPPQRSISLFLLDKVLSFFVLALAGGLAIYWLFDRPEAVVLAACFVSILAVGILGLNRMRTPLAGQLKWIGDLSNAIRDSVNAAGRWIWIDVLAIVARKMVLDPVMYMTLFHALGIKTSFLAVLQVSNVISLVSMVPITPQGLGVVELSSVILFGKIGIDSAATAALLLVQRPLHILFSGVIIAIPFFHASQRHTGECGDSVKL